MSLEFIIFTTVCTMASYLWITKGYYVMERVVNYL